MTLTKKILSLILAVVICVTSVPVAFATDADISYDETTQQGENLPVEDETVGSDESETVPDKPAESKPLGDNDIVADIYVFYDKSDIHGAGHTWIYIENLTDQELKVGVYTLPPNEGVSVGTLPEYDGWGIYYNVEAYQQGIYGMED
jgi:hypothetical protein